MLRAGEHGRINLLSCRSGLLGVLRRLEEHIAYALAFLYSKLQSLCNTAPVVFSQNYSVDDYIYIMLDVLLELYLILIKPLHLPINPDSGISVATYSVDYILVFTLPAANYRTKDGKPRTLFMTLNALNYAVYALTFYNASAYRAVRNSYPRIEQPEIVINLRDCTNSGSRILIRSLLVNRNSRRQPLYELHIRFFHKSEELPRIRRERLYVFLLSLGVDCIKGK